MLQGYVALYTALGGFDQFILSGICQAKLKPDSGFEYQIIVPIEAVFASTDENTGNLEPYVYVDIPKANAEIEAKKASL